MCKYFQYSRWAYYKSHQQHCSDSISEGMMLEMIQRERHIQPRLGGKKLYWMLQNDLHQINPHFGRDKLFALLRKHDLLVEAKSQYRKTTHSYHHFHYCGGF